MRTAIYMFFRHQLGPFMQWFFETFGALGVLVVLGLLGFGLYSAVKHSIAEEVAKKVQEAAAAESNRSKKKEKSHV